MAAKRKTVTVLLVIVGLLLALALAAYGLFSHYTSKLNRVDPASAERVPALSPDPLLEESDLTSAEQEALERQLQDNLEAQSDRDYSSKDVTNILLIGVDNDYAPGLERWGNADGLVIASINKKTSELVLTSLMRDIYVSIPGKFNTKLTLTYHYGGTDYLIDAIQSNLGIPIDNYILVNYINVADIVDAVGGLELDVNAAELEEMAGKIRNINQLLGLPMTDNYIPESQAGTLQLNGVQVAAYLRLRAAGNNDFERTERARLVLTKLLDKVRGLSFSDFNRLADTLLPCITTDLSQARIFSLLLNAPQYMKYELVSSRIPVDDSFYFANLSGSTLVIDYEVNREYLYRSIYEGSR